LRLQVWENVNGVAELLEQRDHVRMLAEGVSDLRVAMVHYGVGTEHVSATVIGQDGDVHAVQLAAVADVAQTSERLARMLRAPMRFPPSELSAALHEFSSGWGRTLLPDSELLAGYDVLVVVPHHFLNDLPLQLVQVGTGEERLANRFGISFCSSATMFERTVGRNPARLREDATPRVCCALGVDVVGGDPRYAELARTCASVFPEPVWAISRDMLKSPTAARAADVICLVCHGVTNTQEHDDSGLLLVGGFAGRNELSIPLHLGKIYQFRDLPFSYVPPQVEVAPEFREGPYLPELMTITEVRALLETNAQLVMLLGCSTATGLLRSGDSYASLAYQWLQAGAVSVLGHQWEADFPFVDGWVPVFLHHWVERRKPKAIAVRDSLNQVLAEGLVRRDALLLWGAVVLLGDWI
jgi:hypothetical protein